MREFKWTDGMLGDRPLATFTNARVAILNLLDCKYDDFAQRGLVYAPFFGDVWQPLSDELIAAVRQHLIDAFGTDFRPSNIFQAIQAACWENRFDPVADYLRGLKWDQEKRIDDALTRYLGAPESDYIRAVSRSLFMTVTRRVLQPGCKADSIFVLVGGQGAGKSSFALALAGHSDFFTDQEVIGLPVREQQEALRGRWIIEASELGGLERQSIERVKAFASRTHDRARPAYGRLAVDQPRRCVIIASTNEQQFLRDTTGNRRFCIVPVGTIDLEAFRADRDQLLAEGIEAQAAVNDIHLPKELHATAAREQEIYLEDDPLDELLATLEGTVVGDEERIAFSEVWDRIGYSTEKRTTSMKHRLVGCMRRLGWTYCTRPFRLGPKVFRGFKRAMTKRPATGVSGTTRRKLVRTRNSETCN